jgi:hypothetical protein
MPQAGRECSIRTSATRRRPAGACPGDWPAAGLAEAPREGPKRHARGGDLDAGLGQPGPELAVDARQDDVDVIAAPLLLARAIAINQGAPWAVATR